MADSQGVALEIRRGARYRLTMHIFQQAGFLLLATTLAVSGRSPEREVLSFSTNWNVGFGTNVHVVGNHPDLGGWDPLKSVKLRWTVGNNWTGQVAVQKGTAVEFKFITRNGSAGEYCNNGNVGWEPGANRTTATTTAASAPYTGKTIFYYSSWTNATLIEVAGTNAVAHPMQRQGAGRSPGEFLYQAEGIGEAGEGLEFVISGEGQWDNPPYTNWNNNYYTPLDAFLLQDGQIYNYQPAPMVSAARVLTNFVNSTVAGITGRTVRIYLPRGYDEHTWKRYPVLFMQDGTNVFETGVIAGAWSADTIATREISQGRMRECVIVAIDNMANRRTEYEPPGDTYTNEPPGHADLYLRFIMDNVRPMLLFDFRTLADRRNQLMGGSSMGGLFSIYAGYATNVFGGVLAMSPSITRAPNFTAWLRTQPKRPIRIYEDTGSNEGVVGIGEGNYWDRPWEAYDIFLAQGYAPNEDLLMRIGCGDQHNESAWRNRLPGALLFLLPVRDEPNMLAQVYGPPDITAAAATGVVQFETQQHFRYELETATGALATTTWTRQTPQVTEVLPWSTRQLTNSAGPDNGLWLRITSIPSP